MEKVFFRVLNMSLVSGYVIAFLLLLRLVFGRVSKRLSYALWGVALFRLLCPFSIGSIISLVPVQPNAVSTQMLYEQVPKIHSGIASLDSAVNRFLPAGAPQYSVNPLQIHAFIGSVLWIGGMVLLAGYGVVSLVILKYKLRNAEPFPSLKRVFLMDGLQTPFVLGVIHPKIYLPSALGEKEREYVLLHENAHIRRLDHVARLAAYVALCIHWFNPLVWAAFWLSGKDMELSCDENAVSGMELEERKGYSSALLRLSTRKKIKYPTPLAFGEGDVKGRIKSVLSYRKPVWWVSAAALVIAAVLCLGLAVNPKEMQAYELPDGDRFLQELVGTIIIRDGKMSFTVPEKMPNGNYLNIHVSGRIELEDGSGMSLHGFEAVEEWLPGQHYEEALFAPSADSWEVTFDAVLRDRNGIQDVITAVSSTKEGKVMTQQIQPQMMIYVNKRLYSATYKEVSDMVAKEAEISEYDSPYIGEIVSSVGENQTPTEELQSNFGCVGAYVIFNGSGIAISMDGKWMQFDPMG